ncbi:hypothetical protein MKZ38_004682 [Zalerion maritima]|uniref:Uncharacterized protein n=1 Tax=Zalerion maritima TaxID=339359 RepID=A0AAD5RLB2_9PEZI|nr:hypothetical protein MKZ38_004682 [Zalerion maritima]
MGKKRRRHPTLEELLERAWCYYCERDFEDLKLLISHQKAKHFKCDRCGRRLNTAGGLSVHMNQVHKESLSNVENALSNRQGLDVEIFGMEGIPEDVVQQHNQRIIQNFYQAQADRQTATGNPPSGAGADHSRKKLKFESPEELKTRLREYAARRLSEKAAAPPSNPRDVQSPGQGNMPFNAPPHGHPGYPGAAPSAYNGLQQSNLPARPTANPTSPGLPQRPQQQQYGSNYWPPAGGNASTVDELVSGASRQNDNIDHIIRMAEAGVKPAKEDAPAEKKKKDKNRMVFNNEERCPEELLSMILA